MSYTELLKTAKFCRDYWPERTAKVIKTADDICDNVFLFDMPWDMERTEQAVDFKDKIDWYYKLNGDNEFLFQLNRHGFLIHLGQAYYLTGNNKYLEKFTGLLNDWIDNVPVDDGVNSPWRSLEVGMRCDNWVKALAYIEDTPYFTEELKSKVELNINEHIKILKNTHKAFQKGSNWGVIQDSGMFAAGAYYKDKEIMDLAVQRLILETNLQIMADGVHWEQSCGYHNAVLMCLYNVIYYAGICDYVLPDELTDTVYKVALVNLKWIKPDGEQPLLGDSDNNNIRDMLSRAALIFDDPVFRGLGFCELDYDSSWLFGTDGIEKYRKTEKKLPDFLNAQLPDSGNYIFRSSWDKDANWLLFHNGYTGGGHAHADKLHFSLTVAGHDVLVDSGRYNYMNCKERRFIKEPQGHNTTVVGNKKFLNVVSEWGVENPALAVQYPFYDEDKCALAGGAHLGYKDFPSTYVERKILYIKPDIYIIIDRFKTAFANTYFQYFHFSPEGEVEIIDNTVCYRDKAVAAKLHFMLPDIKISNMNSVFSPNYNCKVNNFAIETEFRRKSDACAVTVIYGNKNEKFVPYSVRNTEVRVLVSNEILNEDQACAVIINTQDKEYTVYIAHEEIMRPVTCNGKTATGRIMVFENDRIIFRKW